MATVTIRRNVLLRAVVTDRLKEEVSQEFQDAADQIAQRLEELDTAGRRYITDLQRTDLQRAMALRQQVEQEKQRQEQVRESLLQRKQDVAEWRNGDEVVRGTIEGVVEVKEGDNLAVMLGGTEMVVEDDIVKEIRELSPDDLRTAVRDALVEQAQAEESQPSSGVIGAIETP